MKTIKLYTKWVKLGKKVKRELILVALLPDLTESNFFCNKDDQLVGAIL